MKKFKKLIKAGIIFILIYLAFLFAAYIEYNTNIEIQKQKIKDEMMITQTKLENIIGARIISGKGIKPYIEISTDFKQDTFELFAKNIYESKDGLVKSLTFITDSTITHIYPYEENKQAIGIDLANIEEQSEWILFGMKNDKNILAAPVDLVQGGTGLIIRIPIAIDGDYYGQLAIVFDFDKTMELTGLVELSEDYFVKLTTYNTLKNEYLTVWENTDSEIFEQIARGINFYDIDLKLEVAPKSGWQGYSTFFLLIILIGFFISIATSYFFYKLLASEESLVSKNLLLKTSEDELIIKYQEVLDQKQKNQHLAIHDPLTGFYNRRKCIEDLEKKIEEGMDFTIFLCDVDNFKRINDTRGHTYGDNILREIANLIKDVTSRFENNYRIGGDEFIVIIPNLKDSAEITGRMNYFYKELAKNSSEGQINNRVTISVGISRFPIDGDIVEDLIMKADLAMYEAKRKGKDQFCFFEHALLENLINKVEIENQIRYSLKHSGFMLLYQPIIDKNTAQIESFEALIRMKHSDISPAVFIPIAEETGLIIEIGKWVIDETLRQLNKWRKEGYLLKPVAINISPAQIYDGELENYLLASLRYNDIAASLIVIEITENLLLRNIEESIESLNKLRKIGCKISLDDFGTGYSSLSYLTYIPVDKVKLDKSIKDRFLLSGNIEVMKVLIELCHTLDLEVVIEGVETITELKKLLSTESDYFQGYYFAKPLPPEDAIKLIRIEYDGL
ncbi:MAG: EAL domain-containing protein [Gudongella sp.]|nr:EAL domain-containing protein [Gudongella sp.]